MNETLLQYLLESAVGLTLLFLFYALVLRKETCFQFNRFYLMAALFLSLVVPLSQLPGIALWPEPVEQEIVLEAAFEPVSLVASQDVATSQETFNYWSLLYAVYGVGVLFFAIRFLVQFVRLRQFANQEGTSFFLPNRAPVILTHGQFPTFSFWRWVFFDNSQPLTPEETERILQHEQVHIDQRHTLDVLLVSLAGIVFWFNPLLLLFKKALEQTHEFIADAHVARTSSPSAYSSLLVKQVFKNADFHLGSYFFLNKSLTLTRIKMMKKLHQSPKRSRMLLVIPALALFLTAVAAMRPVSKEEASINSIGKAQEGAAQFPGGREALNAYVKNRLVLPEVAFQKRKSEQDFVKVTGTIEVEVQEDGTAVYRRTVDLDVRPNHSEVVTAVTKQFAVLVSQMPRWTPAQKNGKPLSSKETISISSVSGNFLTYASYLDSRQQKTSVSSKANGIKGSNTNEEVIVTGKPLPGQLPQEQKASSTHKEVTVVGRPTSTELKQEEPVDTKVFIAVEQMPEFPGGQAAMFKYLTDNIVYPEDAKQAKISGVMVASFIVNAQGKVTKVEVVKKLHSSLDQAFVKALQNMPLWTPGTQNGKAVSVKYTVPFRVVGETTPTTAKEQAQVKDDRVFIAVQQMPEFPGGQKALFKYLSDVIDFPEEARQAKAEGTAVATFVVTAEGKITKVEVIRKVHPALDQAFQKALQNMPDWAPGTQNGKPVNVKYTVPFRVVLP
ncbi:M56 family metallopeptidase [Rufibacter tibetensis]|uniref:TonB C-terminal domain-containing protein n=1 Tax=Rufibacter tibetensis TaxID=512763 RepID=A0A0P0C835_9BACT|nr:M56 family metallopeptidase [Rufibacter tibetensis]ALI99617.1 hypothetical protein DC20_12345 [Rufibacter tibetensis]